MRDHAIEPVFFRLEPRKKQGEGAVSALQSSIAAKFLAELIETQKVDQHIVDQLRSLLAMEGKPKVDKLVEIFTSPPDKEVK